MPLLLESPQWSEGKSSSPKDLMERRKKGKRKKKEKGKGKEKKTLLIALIS